MPYIGTQPKDVRSFGRAQFDFTATQGQTAFTGADDDGKTLGFTEGQIQVYVNGILMDASDYTTSNTNTVTLVSAANLNDIVTVVALQTDIPNSDYVPISGGTFTGNISGTTADFSGDVDVDGLVDASGVARNSNAIRVGASTAGTGYGFRIGSDGANDPLEIWRDHTNGNQKQFSVDYYGRVTMPNQPAFRAYSNNSSWTALTANTWVTAALEAEEYDQGSNYDTTNYRFTAPIDGLYQFTLHIYGRVNPSGQTASSNYWSARFGKNGNTQGDHCIVGYYSDGEQDNTCTLTSTLDLSANDYIQIYVRGHGYQADYYRALCRFEGRLVG